MRYADLLREFAVAVGVPEVEVFLANEELLVDDVPIAFCREGDEAESGEIMMFSSFAAPDHLSTEALHQMLLEANWFWHGTGGASFGVNPESGDIVLAVRFRRVGLSGEGLAALCSQFVDVLQTWRELLLTPSTADLLGLVDDPLHQMGTQHA